MNIQLTETNFRIYRGVWLCTIRIGFLLLFCGQSLAGLAHIGSIVVDNPDFSEYVTDRIEYKVVDDQWQNDAVYADSGWIRCHSNALNIGLVRKGVWMRMKLTSTLEDSLTFLIENTFIDLAEVYYIRNGKLVLGSHDGLDIGKSKKDSYPILRFKTEGASEEVIYIYVRSELEPTISLWLHSSASYQRSYETRLAFFFTLTGIFSVIFLYNLFLFFSIRDRVYVYYSLYVLVIYFAQTTTSSLGYNLLGTADLMPQGRFIFIAIGLVAICSRFFLVSFFKRDLYSSINRRSKRIYNSFLLIGLAILVLPAFVDRFFVFWFMNFGMMYVAIGILYASILLYRNGVQRARFILWAWSPFLLGVLLFSLTNAGVLEHSFIAQYTMPIGASIETVLLSFALGFRIAELKSENRKNDLAVMAQTNKFQQLELDMTKTQLLALRSQMNPHFIFNAMNSIQYWIQEKKVEKSQELIYEFSRLIRTMLTHARSESVSVEEEVKFLTDYLNVEKSRNNDLFQFDIDVDPILIEEEVHIPPTMIQPICENAVKHAFVFGEERTNHIRIEFKMGPMDETIEIWVVDNGIGYNTTQKTIERRSLGLSIINERIALLHRQSKQAELNIMPNTSESGKGTIAFVVLPIMN